MQTIHTTAHTGADGLLKIELATGISDSEVDIEVRFPARARSREEWIAFIDQTAGSIDDPTFVRPPQGYFEPRDEMP